MTTGWTQGRSPQRAPLPASLHLTSSFLCRARPLTCSHTLLSPPGDRMTRLGASARVQPPEDRLSCLSGWPFSFEVSSCNYTHKRSPKHLEAVCTESWSGCVCRNI